MPTQKLPVGHGSWVVLMAEFRKCFAGPGSSRLERISRCSIADCQAPVHRSGVWHGVSDLCSFSPSVCPWILVFTVCCFRGRNYHTCRNLVRCKKHLTSESALNFSLTLWTWFRQILISPINVMGCQWNHEFDLQWWQLLFCESVLCHWAVTHWSWQPPCH